MIVEYKGAAVCSVCRNLNVRRHHSNSEELSFKGNELRPGHRLKIIKIAPGRSISDLFVPIDSHLR